MKIQILLDMPVPQEKKYPTKEEACGSVEEQVRDALDLIDSGKSSHVEWKMINRLYASLKNKKSPRARNLVQMIEPVMSKYGQHGTSEKE